jgi:hypothetical protein
VCEDIGDGSPGATVNVTLSLAWDSPEDAQRSEQFGEAWEVTFGRDGDPGRGIITFPSLQMHDFPVTVALRYADAGTWRVRRAR